MRFIRVGRVGLAAGVAVAALAAGSGAAATRPAPVAFTEPVRLTPTTGFGGFEPTLVVDHSNNTWITAHKSYHGQVSPDSGSAAGVRSSSWLWMTKDGKTFTEPPGRTALREHEQFVGDEGDLAVSPDNDVYYVDLGLVSSSFASWHVDGPGKASLTHQTPRLAHAVAPSDRPFIAAGPNKSLLVVHNQIGALSLGTNSYGGFNSNGSDGPLGSAQLFVSRDGGVTYDSALPYVVNSGAFCRPLIDQRDAKKMLAVCTSMDTARGKPEDATDRVFSMRSIDGGKTWARSEMRKTSGGTSGSFRACGNFPSVAQDRRGTIHAICTENAISGFVTTTGRVIHYTSRNFGQIWTSRDVTPLPGIWNQTSLAIAPNGRLGIGGYYRPDTSSTWQYRAGVYTPGARARTVEVSAGMPIDRADAGTAPGDFNQIGFGPDSKLRVTFNVADFQDLANQPSKYTGLFNVYYAQQM